MPRAWGRHTMVGAGGIMREPSSEGETLAWAVDKLRRLSRILRSGGVQTARDAADNLTQIAAVLGELRDQVAQGYHRNPVLMIHNPPMAVRRSLPGSKVVGIMSNDVHEVRYTHADDDKPYRHEFEEGVQMFATERGGQRDVLLTHVDGKPLWEDF